MKSLATIFIVILTFSISYSQTDTFRLGFTGAYPNYYNNATYQVNWSWYNDLHLNYWSGWWVGDTAVSILSNLNSYHLNSYFQPDTIRWASSGRMQVNNAAATTGRFIYNNHWCGTAVTDNTQFGYGQTVMFYDKNSNCNIQQGTSGAIL